MAFKVFNNWDEAWDQWKAQLLAVAPRSPPPTSRRARQQCTPPGVCFKCNQTRHWAKHCPSPCPLPGPCPQCGQSGHWKNNCPSLFLQGRSVSHFHSQQSEVLMDLLGLVAEDWCNPGTSGPFKITSEEPKVTVQEADRPQSPTWCYLTSQVSFILHRSPWLGRMVSSTSQKERQFYLNLKLLIKVNFKIQITK
jgi:hypothetical protein